MKLTVHLGENSYPIYIENHILDHAASYIAETFSGRRVMIISDDQVYPLYGCRLKAQLEKHYECFHLVLPHGEATKSFQNLPVLYGAMLDAGISRSDLVIALGGGVIGDLAGFAAASYLRGVRLIQIPTSLSSVGGKVAVDLPQGKNLAGAFYQPSLVLIDPTVLDTLAPHFVSDGMGEVIKYGCIKDAELFELLRSHRSFADLQPELPSVIARCVDIKRHACRPFGRHVPGQEKSARQLEPDPSGRNRQKPDLPDFHRFLPSGTDDLKYLALDEWRTET